MSLILKSPDVALLGENEIDVDAISFNGSSSYIQYTNNFFRDTDLRYTEVGNAFTLSFWIKPTLTNNGTFRIIDVRDGTTNQIYQVYISTNATTDRRIIIQYEDDNSNFIGINTGYQATLLNAVQWNHVLYSVKQQGGASGDGLHQLYVNDTAVTFTDTDTGDITATPTSTTDSTIGKLQNAGSGYYQGCLSEVWMKDSYYDLSSEGNRRRFISSNDKPVQLPASPLVYLKGTASTWTNTGSTDLGTQTLNNITDCADSPSD
jgi:hypothetical protein